MAVRQLHHLLSGSIFHEGHFTLTRITSLCRARASFTRDQSLHRHLTYLLYPNSNTQDCHLPAGISLLEPQDTKSEMFEPTQNLHRGSEPGHHHRLLHPRAPGATTMGAAHAFEEEAESRCATWSWRYCDSCDCLSHVSRRPIPHFNRCYRGLRCLGPYHVSYSTCPCRALESSVVCTRALELVIGVVCACLPSTNLLYERIRRGEQNQMGNLPRTAGDLKKGSSSSSSYWRSMLPNKQLRTTRTAIPVAERNAISLTGPANFDTELAVLTGQPIGMRPLTEESARKSEQTVEDWVYNPRANSMDGRREGWLAQGGESSALGCSRDRVPNWQNHEMEARKSWEAVWEKAISSEGLASIPEDDAPPRLQLATHPPPDREHLTK